VVDTFALLGEEARKDAQLVERLDQLPHYVADHSGGAARGTLDGLTVVAEVRCILGG